MDSLTKNDIQKKEKEIQNIVRHKRDGWNVEYWDERNKVVSFFGVLDFRVFLVFLFRKRLGQSGNFIF